MKHIINTLKLAAMLLLLAGMVLSCGKDNEKENVSLKGTKWKLEGIVDAKTGILTELEPKDCEECYTLTFDTDISAHGMAIKTPLCILNLYKMELCTPRAILYDDEISDSMIYIEIFYSLISYKHENNKLKLFYNQKGYLLYNLVDL
ncbi:MAG: hypothetical protein LBK94_10910 [Prevotellaceae bacterium]|jgi:hypothetical protein|nr:hypothetical protein [Prevotellaceae bacterium]